MGATSRQWIAGICLCLAGCTPLANVVKTTIVQPLQYCSDFEDCLEQRRNRAVAEEAWAQYVSSCTEAPSPDFACGFKEGYASYLFEGGSGNPPPLPPKFYWRMDYETIAGRIAILDWFNGYREGTLAAHQSGFRNLVTLPASTGLPKQTSASSASPADDTKPAKEQLDPRPAEINWMPNGSTLPVSFQEETPRPWSVPDNSGPAAVSWVPFQDLKTGKTVYVKD